MTDKQEHNPIDPGLFDTQQLLRGVDPPPEGSFRLEDILAEYAGDSPAAPTPEVPPEPVPEERPPVPSGEGASPLPPPDDDFWDGLFAVAEEEEPSPDDPTREFPPGKKRPPKENKAKSQKKPPAKRELPEPAPKPEPVSKEEPLRREEPPAPQSAVRREAPAETSPSGTEAASSAPEPELPPEEAEEDAPLSMEDIVANTVDAVKEQQAKRQAQFLKQLEKIRKKASRAAPKSRPVEQRPLPETPEDEPPPSETANWHKRRYRECRRSLVWAVPLLILLWMPWVLSQLGTEVPFFSESSDNAALCVLVPQAALCILCWPVFRSAMEGLLERSWTACASALLATIATLLDEMTLLLLPQRSEVAPLGGAAAALVVFSLWGLTGYHKGMAETFRTAAMGAPSRLVDCCDAGIAKGSGGLRGFYARVDMEDTGAQWQRLLLPVLAGASAVFAVLASIGQGRAQDLLWCWSAILCASSSLAFPLVFCVPFGRLAARLARNGAAVAGQYGAAMLASDHRLVVTDSDLFPMGAASLSGMKLYGEEREHAIAYAATLLVQGGGLLGRLFEDLCHSEDIEYEPLEHFHVHDDSGVSGMIHGETVLVGTAAFMRHMAVRLPASLPGKTPVCLAVDGELTAVFAVKYTAADTVSTALNALKRNSLQLILAVRDGNVTSKLLRTRFGVDGGAVMPELSERLSLSDPEREAGGPNGLLYRDGLLPFVSLVAGSRRLCQTVQVGNLLSILGSVSGVLLGFYLTFMGSYNVLTPVLVLTYLLLWVVPILPMVWGVDKL